MSRAMQGRGRLAHGMSLRRFEMTVGRWRTVSKLGLDELGGKSSCRPPARVVPGEPRDGSAGLRRAREVAQQIHQEASIPDARKVPVRVWCRGRDSCYWAVTAGAASRWRSTKLERRLKREPARQGKAWQGQQRKGSNASARPPTRPPTRHSITRHRARPRSERGDWSDVVASPLAIATHVSI